MPDSSGVVVPGLATSAAVALIANVFEQLGQSKQLPHLQRNRRPQKTVSGDKGLPKNFTFAPHNGTG